MELEPQNKASICIGFSGEMDISKNPDTNILTSLHLEIDPQQAFH